MFEKAEILAIATSAAAHAAARQALIAENVANADTPGYVAKDSIDFATAYEAASNRAMARTRPAHLPEASMPPEVVIAADPGQLSPNGNGVSLETEMVRAADAQREHDLAIVVYGKSLDILRASLGRR